MNDNNDGDDAAKAAFMLSIPFIILGYNLFGVGGAILLGFTSYLAIGVLFQIFEYLFVWLGVALVLILIISSIVNFWNFRV